MTQPSYQLCTHRDDLGVIVAFELRDSQNKRYSLNAWRAQAVVESIEEILATDSSRCSLSQDSSLLLNEHLGVHILLVIQAIRPLASHQRIRLVAQGIARMSREEATYWHAQSVHRGGLPALRRLFSP